MARLDLNETLERIRLLIRAGYPVIYVVSYEEARVRDYFAKILRTIKTESPAKNLVCWYEGVGIQVAPPLTQSAEDEDWLSMEGAPPVSHWQNQGAAMPLDALTAARDATMIANPALGDSLALFYDLHPYLSEVGAGLPPLVRPLRNAADSVRHYYDTNRQAPLGQRFYKTIVIVAPSAARLSPELERDTIVIDFPLPERDELLVTLAGMLSHQDARTVLARSFRAPIVDRFIGRPGFASGRLSFPADMDAEAKAMCGDRATVEDYKIRLCDLISGAGRGLTLEDYRRGLNIFAVRGEKLCPRHIEDMLHLKAKAINNQALQYTPHVEIELGGLDSIRQWIRVRREAAVSDAVRQKHHLPSPRGVMLVGASGGGKSQLAKLIAKEFNLALLRLDVGALFGSFVGESEERTRRALQLAEVLAPVVLWLDEVDKAFTGVGAAGDNGVSARVFGHFLTWLAEKEGSVFVVATANDINRIMANFPEFCRKGRFDEIFFVPLPNEAARKAIFRIYLRRHFEGADRLLALEPQDIVRLAANYNAPAPEDGSDLLDRFCALLARPMVSANMTGAEIQYAVEEALFRAYDSSQGRGTTPSLTPDLVIETVNNSRGRALYVPGGAEAANFAALEATARIKGWPRAE